MPPPLLSRRRFSARAFAAEPAEARRVAERDEGAHDTDEIFEQDPGPSLDRDDDHEVDEPDEDGRHRA